MTSMQATKAGRVPPATGHDPAIPDIGRRDMRLAMGIVVVVSLLLVVGAAIGLAIAP